ncbi:MAG: hypothetical protein MI685_09525 [Chlorobiales bacterium]|nr:hypothetical protein [Chlorobiales bacterium]
MKSIICSDDYVLLELKSVHYPLRFCWYKSFEGCLIYFAGFKTRNEAQAWAMKKGFIPKLEYDGEF